MNAQEIFDTVTRHLFTQGRPARTQVHGSGQCLYRHQDEDGNLLKCAVGCLIPDELYSPKMEGRGITDLIAHSKNLGNRLSKLDYTIPTYFDEHTMLLGDLQSIHDTAWERDTETYAPHTLRSYLCDVANRRGLKTYVVEECYAKAAPQVR